MHVLGSPNKIISWPFGQGLESPQNRDCRDSPTHRSSIKSATVRVRWVGARLKLQSWQFDGRELDFFGSVKPENTVEFASGFYALQTQTYINTIIWGELQKVSSSHMDNDSYMYGKLLEFLRVSSLNPEFLIQCPDPEVLPSWVHVTERNSRSSKDLW